MIRRPPRSTLFPTRRSSDLTPPEEDGILLGITRETLLAVADELKLGVRLASLPLRSEEHTSELQSQSNLVCRLLLEKKKKKKKYHNLILDNPGNHSS